MQKKPKNFTSKVLDRIMEDPLQKTLLCLSRYHPKSEVWALYEAPPGLRAHGL